ncbi:MULTISPECIES: Cof-type HAD-IIB family hydrolase [unclassified Streptococcus]|uniref:Cof-type HAD-IIB family hydrolase n=1 Tax=unclassified Streptococcus TaxID=2608887 RepID=UPI001071BE9B|nr:MULTISPECIES: Cof-type HAD-IIB family hydrolase [unclassified Streptococcus]MBF0786334.1 HAD family phosphatase [Streptococcus sp. 19428wC2_LYSM12]MCQ9212443.1 Cof-type HAD-IIB family hydrolase [Streptococcus sp. B01]MCQ9213781.1 Cof-type HAD-IIB family hydrolase [Streptococcus sp. O1]TFV06745.1 HAD family phosphatase [Streptococcus sp. LYSM12]
MIKLLALDMDGTLLNSQKQLTEPQIKAIHKAVQSGVKLVLCTGRMLTGVKPYFNQLGLDAENEYVIVNNGCSTHQTSDWKLIDWAELSPEQIEYLATFLPESSMQLTLFDEEHYYVLEDEPNQYSHADAKLVYVEPTILSMENATNQTRHLFQAMFVGTQEATDAFETKHASTLSENFDVVRSQAVLLEILPAGTNKASALKKLADHLQILPEEIMAIGDANNDIEMLTFAGLSIAMGNANDLVKSLADDITDTNDQDGVAKAIYKHIIGEHS